MLQEVRFDLLRIRIIAIHFIDSDNNRRICRLGIFNGFNRLRHDAIISCHYKDDNIHRLCATSSHFRESRVTRRIKDRNLFSRFQLKLIGTNMLGDTARFARRHIGCPQSIQQGRLAVINMSHNRNHRRTRLAIFFIRRCIINDKVIFNVRLRNTFNCMAEIFDNQLGRIGIENIIHRCHCALLHKVFHNVARAFRHTVRQFRNSNSFGDNNFSLNFFTVSSATALTLLFTFAGAFHRSK